MNLPRKIIHADMDVFMPRLSNEIIPCYRGKPLVVGGEPHQRVVVAMKEESLSPAMLS